MRLTIAALLLFTTDDKGRPITEVMGLDYQKMLGDQG